MASSGGGETSGEHPKPSDVVQKVGKQLPVRQPQSPTDAYVVFGSRSRRVRSGLAGEPDRGLSLEWCVRKLEAVQGRKLPNIARNWRMAIPAVFHAEGHAAAALRDLAKQSPDTELNAEIAINNRPCDGPLGCDDILPALLPRDSKLRVYMNDEHRQLSWYKDYTGTGEAIADE